MQKKKDNFLDKIVKKDYNNELEKILEKKYFAENVKSLLLSILYKIETAYKDYEKVKPNIPSKEEFIKSIILSIKNNCDDIKVVKVNSRESAMLGNKTFLVEKDKKRIICYPIERKLLYSISKINKKEKIIKDKYYIIDKTLSDLINVGNNIDTVEPMRDFNGYSWTTIPREMESIYHNLVYQNIRILVGYRFLNNWITNNQYILDYMETFQNKLEEKYGEENKEQLIETLKKLSVLLAVKYNKELKHELRREKKQTEEKFNIVKNNKTFIQTASRQKQILEKRIKEIDEMVNDKRRLQNEYDKRNSQLPLEEKIFSIRILSKILQKEREDKLKRLEEINSILNPQKFVKFKNILEQKEKYLKLLDTQNLELEIGKNIINLQEIFLHCYKMNVAKVDNKQDLIKMIYEFRYYCLLPITDKKLINEIDILSSLVKEVQMILLKKAHELKVIDTISSEEKIDYEILKNIFNVRVINLEDLYIKVTKEKEKYYMQLFDENIFEEKIEIQGIGKLNKKDLKINRKIKIFN